ncbi:MAG: EAL domain-containing response regulator [Alphaproteobacteria bacterium]|nr:EAL domain-containing response regulator [Alphaproteobacteria bacterium]MBV8548895.1 EAL domain-containing response regulator [Alphaproteobacteria bacterium]
MRMLVIDDEEDICDLIAEIASRRGMEVKTISHPEQVQGLVTAFAPEMIMLDLMMPGTDGVELLRMLAETSKTTKICLMSGSDTRVLNSARRLGSAHGLEVIAALEKPITVAALNGLFESIMSAHKPAHDPADLATAINDGSMPIYLQPVVEIATRRVKGAEALIRLTHPARGVLTPDQFLQSVADQGLMQPMTDMVIKESIRHASRWHQAGENMTLSINVTASTLLDLTLPDRIAELCKHHNLPPERLILEVTENEAMRDVTRTMDVLLRMRIRNIGVSIDDFGTGHSSLRELQRMPFSELKVDKGFVSDMATSRDCEVIVNSIIDLGHNLGLKVIAEGVEDARTWNMLASKGCDFGQGYLMGKPMPAEDFDRWLVQWRSQPTI